MFGVAIENYTSKNDEILHAGQPFATVEEAWFWFIVAQQARSDGATVSGGRGATPRPCEPLDIYRTVDRLYRNRRLRWDHMKILAHYGKRREAPDWGRQQEQRAHHLWQEAMRELDIALRRRGIVRGAADQLWVN